MRILITGVTGFVGSHLSEALIARGSDQVFGTCLRADWLEECAHLREKVPVFGGDLTNAPHLDRVLRESQPEVIFHLAGYAQTAQSFHEPDLAWAGNLGATRSLYDAVLRWGGKPRILSVGSGLIYGESEDSELALDENAVMRPSSPYASSKAAADLVGYQYWRAAGLEIIRARPFNHFGPRQSPQFAVAAFAKQVAAIEKGKQPPILETGNLTPRRDLSDVRDIVQAYLLLVARGRPGEAYNLGSGQSHTMQSILDRLLALANVPIEVRQKPGLARGTDISAIRANIGKLQRETDWKPKYTLDQTLRDTLAYWRQQ